MTAGQPTRLVRDAWVESFDDPPKRPQRRVLVSASSRQSSPGQRGGASPAPDISEQPRRRAAAVRAPTGWDALVGGDQPLTDGVAIWLLRSMMNFDDVLVVSDIHGSALRCGLYVDLLLAGLVEFNGELTAHPGPTGVDLVDDALRNLPHHKTVEHWIRLGQPHGREFPDMLVASGDLEPLHYVVYHRYRGVRAHYAGILRYLAYVFDGPEEPMGATVAALAALTGAWGYLGPKRRKIPQPLLSSCGPAADFVGWAAEYLNARMSDIAAAGGVNAQANLFGGGV
jgi:hypothetical protein